MALFVISGWTNDTPHRHGDCSQALGQTDGVKDTTPKQIEPSRNLRVAGVLVLLVGVAVIFAGEFDVVFSRDGSAYALLGGGLIGLGGWLYLRGRGTRDA